MSSINQFPKSVKRVLRNFVENTPVLADYYYYYWLYPRNPNLYRYVFSSFSEALAAVPKGALSGYDYRDLYDSRLKDLTEVEKLKPIDYPVLVWLRNAFRDSTTVLDLGGTTGYSYYAYRHFISYPKDVSWTVCEVPKIVEVGKELLNHLPAANLSYITDLAQAKDAEIFLCCGMLQYFEESLVTLLKQLPAKPRYLVINHVPLYQGETYITLQRLMMVRPQTNFVSYIPFKIQNRTQFIQDLEAYGYKLMDSWMQDRQCLIPFHPDRFVDAFHGFYFQLQ
ncbi:hypothetical protein BST81_17160 [Leptolyngbya sp. 'hensonii']|nr:hypothetical protein BST81_17160 [Leptolyngbya sp. 'hensonii']